MMFTDLSMLIEMDKKSDVNLIKNYKIIKIKKNKNNNNNYNKNCINKNKEHFNNDMWYIFASE